MAGAAEGSIVVITMEHALIALALLGAGLLWPGFMARHRALLRSTVRWHRALARLGMASNVLVTATVVVKAWQIFTTTTVYLVHH